MSNITRRNMLLAPFNWFSRGNPTQADQAQALSKFTGVDPEITGVLNTEQTQRQYDEMIGQTRRQFSLRAAKFLFAGIGLYNFGRYALPKVTGSEITGDIPVAQPSAPPLAEAQPQPRSLEPGEALQGSGQNLAEKYPNQMKKFQTPGQPPEAIPQQDPLPRDIPSHERIPPVDSHMDNIVAGSIAAVGYVIVSKFQTPRFLVKDRIGTNINTLATINVLKKDASQEPGAEPL